MRDPKEQTRTTTPLLGDFAFYTFHTFSSSDFISNFISNAGTKQLKCLCYWFLLCTTPKHKDFPAENKLLVLLNFENWINRTEKLNGWNEA